VILVDVSRKLRENSVGAGITVKTEWKDDVISGKIRGIIGLTVGSEWFKNGIFSEIAFGVRLVT
jgi:hypothetical protein